jgi:3',5'-cyclic AMP phosphodiesterase CpdA
VPVNPPRLRIIQISDLHFVTHPLLKRITFNGMFGHDSDAVAALETQMRRMSADLLFMTGDFSTWGDKKSLSDSLAFVRKLGAALKLAPDRVHWIPGNHDVLIDYPRVKKPTRNYTAICGTPPPLIQLKIGGFDVAIFSFDSTVRDGRWPTSSNMGEITKDAYNQFNLASQSIAGKQMIKLVQLHHHPLQIPYKEHQGMKTYWTTMKNGAEFADKMQHEGADLIMHGHEHYPYSVEYRYHGNAKRTVIVSAGTGSQLKNREISFNEIVVIPGYSINLQKHVYRGTGFEVDLNATRIYVR